MDIYRILEAEGKPPVAIKVGFCLPAMLFPPLWAIYNQFWPAFLLCLPITIGLNFGAKAAERAGMSMLALGAYFLLLVFGIAAGKYANFLLTAYLRSKGYKVTNRVEAKNANAALGLDYQASSKKMDY